MSIYAELLEAVENGKKFKVDLIEKSLWINKKQIIKEGEAVHAHDKSKELIEKWDLEDYGIECDIEKDPWITVKFLYSYHYKRSVPKEHSNKRSYFKALSVDELNDFELAYNFDRNLGQAILEGYVLLTSLKGILKWDFGNHWFWQDEDDNDLVVLRSWVE